jgi:SAM-dependent methyltransferase
MDRAHPSALIHPPGASIHSPGASIQPTPAARPALGHFTDPGAAFFVYLPWLLEQWVPELDSVEAMLQEGALGAAVGYGCGAATIALARAYPGSHFFGFDSDAALVRRAQQRAQEQGVAERTTFEQAAPEAIPNHRYALVILLSGLAGSRDPMGVAWRALTTLDPAGSLLIVEPRTGAAGSGRVSSPGSTLAQAGFKRVRPIDETAFARVFEARRMG